MQLPIWGFAFWVLMTLVAYAAFRLDKIRAINGTRRISESTLLMLAFFGGSVGAKQAQRRLHHKTRKEPFRTTINIICVLHGLAVTLLVTWALGWLPALIELVE